MNQNEIHLSKHLWSIAVKLGGIYMELTIPFSVRNDIGNIYRSTFYKIYTPPLVVLSKDQKTTFLLHQTYLSFLSQVPFLPSLSFLVHFVDENRGHYIANPNHALFFRELPQNYHTYPYVCIVWSLQNLVISWPPWKPGTDCLHDIVSPSQRRLHPLGPTQEPTCVCAMLVFNCCSCSAPTCRATRDGWDIYRSK